jgi:hypothetical protein
MKVFPLQAYEPKDWSGLTTENHLGALYMQESQWVSKMIDNIYEVNVGDDLMSLLEQYPTHYVNDNTPFKWLLQGADEKNIPLLDFFDEAGNKPARPGYNGSRFLMKFPEKYFHVTHVIVGEKPDLYKLRIMEEPKLSGTDYIYEVELITNNPGLFIPAEELATNTRWSIEYSLSEQTLSKRGSDINFTSPFEMINVMSSMRKEHTIPGDMIDKGKNMPLAFTWRDKVNGKAMNHTAWMGKLEYEFEKQWRREKARLLMFGTSNRRDDGSYGNMGDSGYAIKAGAGLREQISPSNINYYNKFDLEELIDFALNLSVGKLPEDSRRFVLGTGEYGMKQFSRAVEEFAGADAIKYGTTNRFQGDPMKSTYQGGQFVKMATINGITFELLHIPQYDDHVRNKLHHPDGGTAESNRFTVMDFGTAQGEPNIQLVKQKNYEEIRAYRPGLRDPYTPGGSKMKQTADGVDGFTIYRMAQCGIMVKNPMRMGEWIPNILR